MAEVLLNMMRWQLLLASVTIFSCSSRAVEARATSDAGSDGPVYVLPPERDSAFPPDSAETRDRVKSHCGSVSGAITGELLCDHLYPGLDWDHQGAVSVVSLAPMLARGAAGEDAAVADAYSEGFRFSILTRVPSAPLTETCATLPPLPPGTWLAVLGGVDDWEVRCNSATDVLPGSSFTLTITSVGTLTHDTLGADPLDASADGFDWDAERAEVFSNTLHGTFKATLISTSDAGPPIHVDMAF